MAVPVLLSIPSWQWRACAADLSWLTRRLPAAITGPIQCADETHVVRMPSLHHVCVRHDVLELRWRKERNSDGFELWDTILRASAPFGTEAMLTLAAAWGIDPPAWMGESLEGQAFARMVASCPDVAAIRVLRSSQAVRVHDVPCTLESLAAGTGRSIQSFCIEHEDPAIIRQLLRELGLDARDNINLPMALKGLVTPDTQQ